MDTCKRHTFMEVGGNCIDCGISSVTTTYPTPKDKDREKAEEVAIKILNEAKTYVYPLRIVTDLIAHAIVTARQETVEACLDVINKMPFNQDKYSDSFEEGACSALTAVKQLRQRLADHPLGE